MAGGNKVPFTRQISSRSRHHGALHRIVNPERKFEGNSHDSSVLLQESPKTRDGTPKVAHVDVAAHGADAKVICTHRHPFAAAPRSGRPRQRTRVASRRTGWPGDATLASRAALARRLASWAALVASQTIGLTTAAITVATAAAAVSAASSTVSAVFSTATTVASAVRLHRSMAA